MHGKRSHALHSLNLARFQTTITSSRRVLAGRGRRPAGGGTLELLVPCQGSRLTSVPRGLVLVDTGVAGTLVWLVSVFRGVGTPLRLCE